MILSNEDEIRRLLPWGGGWAARALFEDALTRYLTRTDQDIELAQSIVKAASGQSALKYLTKYSHLTGVDLPLSKVPIELDKNITSIIDLQKMSQLYPTGHFSKRWTDELCKHLGCTKKGLYFSIQKIYQLDSYPHPEYLNLIRTWSWPIIRKILPFSSEEHLEIEFRKEDMAFLCWRFWYRDALRKVFLLDTPDLSNQKFSKWFVFRLIHDATHLLHMTCYPDAGSSLNPNWLLVMESAAMFVEAAYLDMLSKEVEGSIPPIEIFDPHKVKAHVLIGLLERALRVDFDIMIHLEKRSSQEWLGFLNNLLGFGPTMSADFTGDLFSSQTEFDGLPGLGSVYMVGINALEVSENREMVLRGIVPLNYLK